MSEIEQPKQPEEQPTQEQLSREIHALLESIGVSLRFVEIDMKIEQPLSLDIQVAEEQPK